MTKHTFKLVLWGSRYQISSEGMRKIMKHHIGLVTNLHRTGIVGPNLQATQIAHQPTSRGEKCVRISLLGFYSIMSGFYFQNTADQMFMS